MQLYFLSPTSKILLILGIVNKIEKALFQVDFAKTNIRDCNYPELPGIPSSDYEIWFQRGITGNCILGKRKSLLRRKEYALCFDVYDFHRVSSFNCECSKEDWECDVGFERQEGVCNLIDPFLFNISSSGYRKIPGSSCIENVTLRPYISSFVWKTNVSNKVPYKSEPIVMKPKENETSHLMGCSLIVTFLVVILVFF
jgi:hypothetical protein